MRIRNPGLLLLTLFLSPAPSLADTAAAPAAASAADAATGKKVQATVNRLIGAIRFKKDDLAAQQLGVTAMGAALMGDSWASMTPAQQQTFATDLEAVLRGICFPKGRDVFGHFKAILFDVVHVEAGRARIKSTITVHETVKKAEIPLEWVLVPQGDGWRIIDIVSLGESTLAGLRTDQVQPLLQEGGPTRVLEALRAKADALRGKGQ